MLSGTPILAYDVNFHKDYITNGHNGILVEDRNYKKLSEKVLFMKKNTVLSKTIGRNARDLALKKFNLNYIINQQVKMYLNLHSRKISIIVYAEFDQLFKNIWIY